MTMPTIASGSKVMIRVSEPGSRAKTLTKTRRKAATTSGVAVWVSSWLVIASFWCSSETLK